MSEWVLGRGIEDGILPVGLDGGELGVVVVVVVVGGSHEVLGDGVPEEDAEDAVLDGVGLVLVEGDEDQGVVEEARVLEEGLEEGSEPDPGHGDGGVVTVGGHVGGWDLGQSENSLWDSSSGSGCILMNIHCGSLSFFRSS